MAVRDDPLIISFFSSFIVHIIVLVLASTIMQRTNLARPEFFPIALVDVLPAPKETTVPEKKPPPAVKKSPPQKMEKRAAKSERVQRERLSPPATPKEEPSKLTEAKSTVTPKLENPPSFGPTASDEGGGSKAETENLSHKGNAPVIPGNGTTGEGGGTAASGLGRGSGAPGLPGRPMMKPTAKRNRFRPCAPPIRQWHCALEGDVKLRIEVDPEGKVTKAEIIKSGGPGFDEEAVKAVKQSRFEPAQRDGQNIAAEFSYVFRFRLRR